MIFCKLNVAATTGILLTGLAATGAGVLAEPAKEGPRELAHDDGRVAGKRSFADSGHAVRFEAPGEGWSLTAVKIHGSRYGTPRPPAEDFTVYLGDDQYRKIAEFPFPYSKFQRGPQKWVTLQVKSTKVPPKFTLGVWFNAEATKGI